MTTRDLTRAVLPYARHALIAARPQVKEAVGPVGWVVLWPAWAVVTGPMLPMVVRIGVELGIGLLGPRLAPVLDLINALSVYVSDTYLPEPSRAFLVDLAWLLKTSRDGLMEPVRSALAMTPDELNAAGGEG